MAAPRLSSSAVFALLDVVRDDTIFEIQTSSFSGLERKMRALADQNPVVLVHPIAAQKNLVRIKDPASGDFTRRKSRRRASFVTFLASWCTYPVCSTTRFLVEVALIEEEQHSIYDPWHAGVVADGARGVGICRAARAVAH